MNDATPPQPGEAVRCDCGLVLARRLPGGTLKFLVQVQLKPRGLVMRCPSCASETRMRLRKAVVY